jgi:ribosomal protein S27E
MTPVVDKKTLKAYCTAEKCGKELADATVSIFMRRQMLANGMTKNAEKKKLAWSVKCSKCEKEGPPTLDESGKNVVCSYCGADLDNLSAPFLQMLKTNLTALRRAGR